MVKVEPSGATCNGSKTYFSFCKSTSSENLMKYFIINLFIKIFKFRNVLGNGRAPNGGLW